MVSADMLTHMAEVDSVRINPTPHEYIRTLDLYLNC